MREKIKRAAHIIEAASLGDIEVKEASFGRRIRSPDEISDDLQLAINTTHHGEVSEHSEEVFFVLASLTLEIVTIEKDRQEQASGDHESRQEGRDDDDSDLPSSEALAWVRAAYELRYRLPKELNANEEEMSAFAGTNGVFNAWPYFREFVQSSLARMGLPPVFLPLFRVPRSKGD